MNNSQKKGNVNGPEKSRYSGCSGGAEQNI